MHRFQIRPNALGRIRLLHLYGDKFPIAAFPIDHPISAGTPAQRGRTAPHFKGRHPWLDRRIRFSE